MTDIPIPAEWRYSINYGPEGEANYAFVYDEGGHLVSNLKIHHAIAVVEQMNDRAAQAERMARLEEALRDIRDGRGKCKTCGTPATGGGAGFTDCDCVRPSWTPQDPADIAARALSQEGSDA